MHPCMSTGGHRARRSSASTAPVPAGRAACPAPWHGATFVAGEPEPPEQTGHGGPTHPEAPALPQPITQFSQRGIGVLLEFLADHGECRVIIAGLATAGVRPGRHLPGAAALPDERLDKRTADTKEYREAPL
jgi:hypothetical protein